MGDIAASNHVEEEEKKEDQASPFSSFPLNSCTRQGLETAGSNDDERDAEILSLLCQPLNFGDNENEAAQHQNNEEASFWAENEYQRTQDEIEKCLKGTFSVKKKRHMVDLWKLRGYALQKGGFLNPQVRKEAWPKLWAAHKQQKQQKLQQKLQQSQSLSIPSSFQQQQSLASTPTKSPNVNDPFVVVSPPHQQLQHHEEMQLLQQGVSQMYWNLHEHMDLPDTSQAQKTQAQTSPLTDVQKVLFPSSPPAQQNGTGTPTKPLADYRISDDQRLNHHHDNEEKVEPFDDEEDDDHSFENGSSPFPSSPPPSSPPPDSLLTPIRHFSPLQRALENTPELKQSTSSDSAVVASWETTTTLTPMTNGTDRRADENGRAGLSRSSTDEDTYLNHMHDLETKEGKEDDDQLVTVEKWSRKASRQERDLLCSVLAPFVAHKNYSSSWPDLVATCLLNLQSAPLARMLVERLSTHHWCEASWLGETKTDQQNTAFAAALSALLQQVDPQLWNFLQKEQQTHCLNTIGAICRQWSRSWFAQDLLDATLHGRLLDLLLVSHPAMPLYVCVALLTTHRRAFFAAAASKKIDSSSISVVQHIFPSWVVGLPRAQAQHRLEQVLQTATAFMQQVPPPLHGSAPSWMSLSRAPTGHLEIAQDAGECDFPITRDNDDAYDPKAVTGFRVRVRQRRLAAAKPVSLPPPSPVEFASDDVVVPIQEKKQGSDDSDRTLHRPKQTPKAKEQQQQEEGNHRYWMPLACFSLILILFVASTNLDFYFSSSHLALKKKLSSKPYRIERTEPTLQSSPYQQQAVKEKQPPQRSRGRRLERANRKSLPPEPEPEPHRPQAALLTSDEQPQYSVLTRDVEEEEIDSVNEDERSFEDIQEEDVDDLAMETQAEAETVSSGAEIEAEVVNEEPLSVQNEATRLVETKFEAESVSLGAEMEAEVNGEPLSGQQETHRPQAQAETGHVETEAEANRGPLSSDEEIQVATEPAETEAEVNGEPLSGQETHGTHTQVEAEPADTGAEVKGESLSGQETHVAHRQVEAEPLEMEIGAEVNREPLSGQPEACHVGAQAEAGPLSGAEIEVEMNGEPLSGQKAHSAESDSRETNGANENDGSETLAEIDSAATSQVENDKAAPSDETSHSIESLDVEDHLQEGAEEEHHDLSTEIAVSDKAIERPKTDDVRSNGTSSYVEPMERGEPRRPACLPACTGCLVSGTQECHVESCHLQGPGPLQLGIDGVLYLNVTPTNDLSTRWHPPIGSGSLMVDEQNGQIQFGPDGVLCLNMTSTEDLSTRWLAPRNKDDERTDPTRGRRKHNLWDSDPNARPPFWMTLT